MARPGPSLRSRLRVLILASSAVFLSTGCLVKRMALNSVGDMVAGGNSGYMTDDDPEFVGHAIPFGLKLMESLIAKAPNHKTLLLGAAAGFTQYAYAYVLLEADVAGVDDYRRYRELRHRARRLFLRGRDYGFQGLEARHRGFRESFEADPDAVLAKMKEDDVPFLYWTGAAWGMAIAISKDNPVLLADQLSVEKLLDRALELDEDYQYGAIHGAMITYEFLRQGAPGDPAERAREHFRRAVELTDGKSAEPYVSLAENLAIRTQDRAEFTRLLETALTIDPDERTEWRLVNLIMQRRARWLLIQADELFVADEVPAGSDRRLRFPF